MIQICRNALTNDNIFDTFMNAVDNTVTNNVKDLKNVKKTKGDVWEEFCKAYLQNIHTSFVQAKFLAELSNNELENFGLQKRDVGIDIIGIDCDGHPHAVQCKFRRRGTVTWRELSTFYALCARTGPWKSHIVMTNAKYVRKEGRVCSKDKNICYGTFAGLERHQWCKIANLGDGNTCVSHTCFEPMSPASLREKRLLRFS
jgi:hypothetical protein